MTIKVGLVSLGCPKNQVDGEILLGKLCQDQNMVLCADPEECDVVLINTCGFINDAKQESIDTILEFCQKKEEGNIRCVIATGCLAERYHDEILKEIPELDGVVALGENNKIAQIVNRVFAGEQYSGQASKYDLPLNGERVLTTPGHYAYLKIAEGCSNRCTFCAIPYVRGNYRSRKMEDILQEARELADCGVKELIVVAQDTTRYGIDLYQKLMLPTLLRELCRIDGFKWVRILYCYPDTITDELLETIASEPKLVKYIDIPLQHINDDILRRMNRRGDGQLVCRAVASIRSKIPGVFVRTTMIVGFPGESEDQFEELCQFVLEQKFERLGCFAYSAEEGTPAADMPDQVDEDVKHRRAEILMERQNQIMDAYSNSLVGQVLPVMVDWFDEDQGIYVGRTEKDAPEIDGTVYFKSENGYVGGDIVSVYIDEADGCDLFGCAVEEE